MVLPKTWSVQYAFEALQGRPRPRQSQDVAFWVSPIFWGVIRIAKKKKPPPPPPWNFPTPCARIAFEGTVSAFCGAPLVGFLSEVRSHQPRVEVAQAPGGNPLSATFWEDPLPGLSHLIANHGGYTPSIAKRT